MLPDADPIAEADGLISSGRAADAAALLRECIAAGRGGLFLRLTLQKALMACGDQSGALAIARETALTHPGVAPAALALGEALLASGHLPAAVGEFQRALRLDPELGRARFQLGAAWLEAGEPEKALEVWRAMDETPTLAEKIAEAEAMRLQPRSDPKFVRHLFDQFSTDYDSRMLCQLQYAAPAILRQLAEFLGLSARRPLRILDLGCGTGLMGEAVRAWASCLDGVDLSPAMIEKARERAIYDVLRVGDICAWLAEPGPEYDLIFAADTLVYLGDLTPLFGGIARRLARGGHFLFTVEKKDGDGFDLGPKRRWRHSEAYLRTGAEQPGLPVVAMMACEPRTEAGIPVQGLAVALARR